MAQDDAVSKAKSVLAGAKKFSSEADPTGSMAKPAPAANPMPKAKVASAPTAGGGDGGVRDQNQKTAAEEGAKIGMHFMPIMHKGGVVKKTEPVLMEKGEGVIPKDKMKNADLGKMAGAKKDEAPAKKEMKGKAKHKHTHIEHHDDGTHTVRHTPKGGGDEVSYSRPDLAGVVDGLHENLGQPAAPAAGPDMAGGAPDAGAAVAAPAAGAPPAGM